MSKKLNEQYFKTREEHDKNVSPYTWGFIVIILLISFIIATMNTVKEDIAQKKGKIESIEDTGKGILNLLSEAPRITKNTNIEFDDLGFEIELHENLKYARYPNQNFVIAHSLDSLKLSYFIGEIPENIKTGNVEENWKSQLLDGNKSYQFRGSIDFTFLSVKEDIKTHKGFYKIDKSEDKYFVIQASVIDNEYEKKIDKMMNVINSFKRIK